MYEKTETKYGDNGGNEMKQDQNKEEMSFSLKFE